MEVSKTAALAGALASVSPTKGVDGAGAPQKGDKASGNFGSVLGQKIDETKPELSTKPPGEGIRFSQHALERMSSRGISFQTSDVLKLNEAAEKAQQKGSQNALVLMGNNAFVVSIKNKTVITAMDKDAMKDNVFTNIDSTIIL